MEKRNERFGLNTSKQTMQHCTVKKARGSDDNCFVAAYTVAMLRKLNLTRLLSSAEEQKAARGSD
jgi:hypothetical protein